MTTLRDGGVTGVRCRSVVQLPYSRDKLVTTNRRTHVGRLAVPSVDVVYCAVDIYCFGDSITLGEYDTERGASATTPER